MSTPEPRDVTGAGRVRRTAGHLRAAGHEVFVRSAADLRAWIARTRGRKLGAIALLAAAVLFFATTRVTLTGAWIGVFLLESPSGRPLELKDDLRLGDGSRLIWGVSFTRVRDLLARDGEVPRLELSWDEKEGSGSVTNVMPGGVQVVTYFGRYVQDDDKAPAGLFVGGASADVAAGPDQNESGMSVRDARGWHHVWCNVNEALQVDGKPPLVYPGDWTFRGSRVLVQGDQRVVIESEHELERGAAHLRMERYAYFKAGRTFFRLGVNLINDGEVPVTVSYAYGDEPWVGNFGSADGNVGWSEHGIVPVVAGIDPRADRWGGILDTKTGLANFLSWEGSLPDLVYFANHAGTPKDTDLGQPLGGNEIFIGLEWRGHVVEPGATFPVRLTIGIAEPGPDGVPAAPAGAVTAR